MARKNKRSPRLCWVVYGRKPNGVDVYLGERVAVSDRQACNWVRRRLYGDTPYSQIPLAFWAEVKRESVTAIGRHRQKQLSLF